MMVRTNTASRRESIYGIYPGAMMLVAMMMLWAMTVVMAVMMLMTMATMVMFVFLMGHRESVYRVNTSFEDVGFGLLHGRGQEDVGHSRAVVIIEHVDVASIRRRLCCDQPPCQKGSKQELRVHLG